jgi:hypothetical protein
MPYSTIDPMDPHYNPFNLDKSKLAQAASRLGTTPATAPIKPANTLTVRAALEQGKVGTGLAVRPDKPEFTISTQQIISLITRFRLRSMTYQQLKSLPLSQLNKEEKDFVAYLRRNPGIFERIAKLDHQPGISVEDVKLASRLAGDALTLTEEDFKYLQSAPLQSPSTLQEEPDEFLANAKNLRTQDLIDTLQQISPQGLTFDQLMSLRAGEQALQERELQALRFLQSPTVSKVLQRVAAPYDERITPEVLRVLSSLLWNPAIYGNTPIVFFQTAPLAQEIDVDPVVGIGGNGNRSIGRINKRTRSGARVEQPKQVVHLEAHHILDICHRLSPKDGEVTLAQLRQYVPQNEAEERALNLLRQTHIFQALAGLEHEPDYLSDADVKLALAEGALVLSDPFIVLVILP